jgi:hypothetical protein
MTVGIGHALQSLPIIKRDFVWSVDDVFARSFMLRMKEQIVGGDTKCSTRLHRGSGIACVIPWSAAQANRSYAR